MNDKLLIIFLGAICLLGITVLSSCAMRKTKRIVLSECTETYPWRVEYVKKDKFPAAKNHYYEVFYSGTQR